MHVLMLFFWFVVTVFLSTELQALQILQKKKHKNSQLDKNSEICQEVQAVCDALGVPKSDTSDIPLLLSQVESKVFYMYKIHIYINISFKIRLNANISVLYSNCDIDYQFLEKLVEVYIGCRALAYHMKSAGWPTYGTKTKYFLW